MYTCVDADMDAHGRKSERETERCCVLTNQPSSPSRQINKGRACIYSGCCFLTSCKRQKGGCTYMYIYIYRSCPNPRLMHH